MALGDFGGGLGPFDAFLSPAMGRIMATNPEALIPHLAEAGLSPEYFTRVAGADNFIPSSGALPAESPYTPPATTPGMQPGQVDPHLSGSDVVGKAGDYYSSMIPGIAGAIKNAFGNVVNYGSGGSATAAPPATSSSPFDQGASAFPFPFLTGPNATTDVASVPPQFDATAPAGGGEAPPGSLSAAISPTKEGATTEVSAAIKKKAPADALLNALAGVRAPPAPPQPQVRPYATHGGNFPQGSPIAALLTSVMSGKATPEQLRLLQAIGKEGR